MNGFAILPSVEPALRVPVTDEDLADAIARLVGRCAKELVASGVSALEAEATAVAMVAEAVGVPAEKTRRRARSMSSTRHTREFWFKVRDRRAFRSPKTQASRSLPSGS